MEIQKIFSNVENPEETLYSVLMTEEELRTFGVISDLAHSGVKRTYKKWVGRGRKGLANKIAKSMQNDIKQLGNSQEKFKLQKRVHNKTLRKSIYQKGNDLGAHTRNADPTVFGQISSFNSKNSNLPKNLFINQEEIIKQASGEKAAKSLVNFDKKRNLGKIKDSDYLVVHQNKAGDELLSHELGHVGNEKEGSWLAKKVNGYKGQLDIRRKATGIAPDGQPYIPKPSLKEAVKNKIDGLAMRKEESNATKRGLGYMKKAGYTKEELSRAKKNLKTAGDSYKHAEHLMSKYPLYQKIQIPSRRDSWFGGFNYIS